jgi:RNA polymerase sigma-B factor
VARIALLHAVERFDPKRGVAFSAYATPTVVGEIKRHFRDHTWALSVPRGAKDRRSGVLRAEESLAQKLGRVPTRGEIAEAADVSTDQVDEVKIANDLYRTAPLDPLGSPVSSDPVEGADHDALEGISTLEVLGRLDDRSRRILYLRFCEDRTQREIGEWIGVGQVQISRLIRSALDRLRDEFREEPSVGRNDDEIPRSPMRTPADR